MARKLARIQLLIDTTANWSAANPILLKGEIGIEVKTGGEPAIKIGNGLSSWNLLNYAFFTQSEINSIMKEIQAQINEIVIAASSGESAEVSQARVNASGKTYTTLKARLDAMDSTAVANKSALEAADTKIKNELSIVSNSCYADVKTSTYSKAVEVYGPIRNYVQFSFKVGNQYKIVLNVNAFEGNPYAVDGVIVLKTTTDKDPAKSVDLITSIELGKVSSGDTVTQYFTPTSDAEYLYLYLNPKYPSETIVDYKVTISKNKTDIIDDKIRDITSVNYCQSLEFVQTPDTHGNYLSRNFIPYSFIKGKEYEVKVLLDNFVERPYITASSYISIRTTSEQNVTSIVDELRSFHDGTGGVYPNKNAEITIRFTATENANYLYVYTNTGTSNIKAAVNISIAHNTGAYEYVGDKINLRKNRYDIEKIASTQKPSVVTTAFQGHSTYKNKLVRLFHTGYAAIYDMPDLWTTITPKGYCKLGSYDTSNQHANSCDFSNKFYNGNTEFPLLYISGGNSGDTMECDVENITLSNGVYSSELIQKITLNQSNFTDYGLEKYWGWPCWLIDNDNEALYCFGCKYRTNGSMAEYDARNKYIITRFDLPTVSKGTVTLTGADVKEQWTSPYDIGFTQGGTIIGDYLFYSFGLGTSASPSYIKVFSLSKKTSVATINLTNTALGSVELEDVCEYDNRLLVGLATNVMYLIDFN